MTGPVAKTPEHRAYWRMRMRCFNPNVPSFRYYGGRGITVCDRWLGAEGFKNFLADMGRRPDGMSLDRINNDGNYETGNCRWATAVQQSRNRRCVKLVGGKTIAEVAQERGVKYDTMRYRINRGLPLNKHTGSDTMLTFNGETKNIKSWGEKLGISRRTISTRLRNGWPVEKALSTPVLLRGEG